VGGDFVEAGEDEVFEGLTVGVSLEIGAVGAALGGCGVDLPARDEWFGVVGFGVCQEGEAVHYYSYAPDVGGRPLERG